ncbi:CNNM domain-containing protein [Pontiella sp.]|uniref:CNNM domain-containing protein n=1 Tax=Pontiella sp. TaxID=2837462 RepID=UPI003566B861
MTTLFIILAGFLFSALFSGVETGSYMINRIRLRQRERERNPSALLLSKLLRNPHIFIFTVLIGNNIAVFLLSKEVTDAYLAGGMASGGRLFGFIPWNAETAATLTLMFPLFLFAEVGPKNLFRKKADSLMYRLSGLLRALVWLFYPFTWPLKELFRILTHGLEKDPGRDLHRLSSDALREYFSTSEKEGVISSDQSRMVDNVTSMHEVPVSMMMIPFKKVPTLPGHATVADFKQLVSGRDTSQAILMDKHSAIGLVSLFTVVNRKLGDGDRLRPFAEDVLKLQENRNLKSVFYRLRRNHHHCAVVVDAHGHPVGFVQLEDIARYIAMK